jgi:hypothetical protein
VVRKLQLLLPGIRIWLDVEHMDDVSKLEEEVLNASVFILFLSCGYFESFNCRRELYTALQACKPIIVIREDDPARGGASLDQFRQLCMLHCRGGGPTGAAEGYPGPASDLLRLFPAHDPPIVWTRVHDFQVSDPIIAQRYSRRTPPHLCPSPARGPAQAISVARPAHRLHDFQVGV